MRICDRCVAATDYPFCHIYLPAKYSSYLCTNNIWAEDPQ